jgi:hypothetical protein
MQRFSSTAWQGKASTQSFTRSLTVGLIGLLVAVMLLAAPAQASESEWRYDTVQTPMPQAKWVEKALMVCIPFQIPYKKTDSVMSPNPG